VIRIEWASPEGYGGHGDWFAEDKRAVLQATIDDANKRLQGWKHWIAEQQPDNGYVAHE